MDIDEIKQETSWPEEDAERVAAEVWVTEEGEHHCFAEFDSEYRAREFAMRMMGSEWYSNIEVRILK